MSGNLMYILPKTNKIAPKNEWLEYFLLSFWGVKRPIFRGKLPNVLPVRQQGFGYY